MNRADPKILIVAGEPSGDLHAAALVREIRARAPRVEIFGIGGDRLRAEGSELLFHIDQMAILGFTEIVRHLPFLRRVMRELERAVTERRPDLVILVDYPGFNLRLARRLRKQPVRIMYYIAPQVWAWGAGRAKRMTRWIDRLAVVFEFEEEMFRSVGIDTHFVGHPLLDGLNTALERDAFLEEMGLHGSAPLLGLLPGSRTQEVRRLLPEMVRTWGLLREEIPNLQVVVGQAPGIPLEVYSQNLYAADVVVAADRTYEVMRYSDALMVASGTATLESACFGTPFVVVYKVSPLSYQIGKRLVRIPDIGLVNVVAGRRVVPEFVQGAFRAERLKPTLLRLLTDQPARQQMKNNLLDVRSRLGQPGASRRTANLAFDLLNEATRAPSLAASLS